jgi:RNA polymerase Rpb4
MNDSDDCSNEDDGEDVPFLISSLAVLEMLQPRVESRKGRKCSGKQLRHRDWIERQVVDYLKGSACTQFRTASNANALHKTLRSNKKTKVSVGNGAISSGFDLTDAESLQILNLSPTEPVEIHLLIDELQDRMTAEQQEELLATIQSYRTAIPKDRDTNGDSLRYGETQEMNGSHDVARKEI